MRGHQELAMVVRNFREFYRCSQVESYELSESQGGLEVRAALECKKLQFTHRTAECYGRS